MQLTKYTVTPDPHNIWKKKTWPQQLEIRTQSWTNKHQAIWMRTTLSSPIFACGENSLEIFSHPFSLPISTTFRPWRLLCPCLPFTDPWSFPTPAPYCHPTFLFSIFQPHSFALPLPFVLLSTLSPLFSAHSPSLIWPPHPPCVNLNPLPHLLSGRTPLWPHPLSKLPYPPIPFPPAPRNPLLTFPHNSACQTQMFRTMITCKGWII